MFLFARHVLFLGDGSSLRAVMSGTARLGQGVRREAESEGSQRPQLGLDAQESDSRPAALGNVAMDTDARYSFGSADGRSGEARGKETRLNLGGLAACPDVPDYRHGNMTKGAARSQPRP